MSGKKVVTYSKKKPLSIQKVEEQTHVEKEDTLQKSSSIPNIIKTDNDELLQKINQDIKRLDIDLSNAESLVPPIRSRKSEIRGRQSIVPTPSEFLDLLCCCDQNEALPFSSWFDEICKIWPKYAKIGESSFSEVIKMTNGEEDVAVKIMPLYRPGDVIIDEERSPEPIALNHLLHEIKALKALEGLRGSRKYAVPTGFTGFNRLMKCAVIKGKYPSGLVSVWEEWLKEHESFNDKPDHYGEESLHVVLVLEFGGKDLEHNRLASLPQMKSVMLQVLSAISLAEDQLSFEHRDLHLGNILMKETHRPDIQLGNYQSIPTEGIMCSIIDYSLARFTINKIPHYRDLSNDEWLFKGDEQQSRQYQIYRDMRDIHREEGWERYDPKSNLIWIKYVLEELLIKYENLGKKDRNLLSQLKEFSKIILDFSNSRDAFNYLYKLN